MSPAAFGVVILDVDSTVADIEGIDWLAARRDVRIASRVADLTDRAMSGAIPLDTVYGERLALIRPTRADVADLSRAYIADVAPGAARTLARFSAAGVRVLLLSGGIREAILPLASHLGVSDSNVLAVSISFDSHGDFAGHDRSSPLTTSNGKHVVVESLRLQSPVLAVGDGATDLAMRPAVTAFAAYTGFVRREPVVRQADYEIRSFDELAHLVLP
ncbi:MAG: phosphoserine phosphatase [Gemmatimonadaceae bacterium]